MILPNNGRVRMFELKLDTPLEYGNKKIEKIDFDFDKLTGQDLIDAEKEVRLTRPAIVVVEADGEFLTALAAKAAGIESVILKDLPADKFLEVRTIARNFINISLGILDKSLKRY